MISLTVVASLGFVGRDYGIRTIVTLATDGVPAEEQGVTAVLHGVVNTRVAVEDATLWAQTGLWGTPLYWQDAVHRWPDRHAAAVRAVAHAPPGAVLVHCGRGHDRTGIVTALLLWLTDVAPDDIAVDYELSEASLRSDERATLHRMLKQRRDFGDRQCRFSVIRSRVDGRRCACPQEPPCMAP